MDINFLLVAVLTLFLILVIRGYKKGFLQIVVYFAGMIFIIIAVRKISPSVSEYIINNTSAYTEIKDSITEALSEKNSVLDNTNVENQKLTIESYDMPDLIKEKLQINNTAESYKAFLVEVFEEYVSSYLAKTAVNALSFVGLFIALWICFRLVLYLCKLISHIPVIKGLNKMLGALLGFVEAIIISWLFFFIVIVFMGNSLGTKLMYMVNESEILKALFNSNILLVFIS